MGSRCADHVTPLYPQKLALTSLTGGGRSVGIIRVRTKATEFSLVFILKRGICYTEMSNLLYFQYMFLDPTVSRDYLRTIFYTILGTAVAQWLRCCATNRKVADSIPACVIGIFH